MKTILSKPINVAIAFTIVTVSAVVLLVASTIAARAAFIELKEVSADYKSFFPGGSDPLITDNGQPNRGLDKEISLGINTDIANFLYFDNVVHGRTDNIKGTNSGQFRTVGWNFKFGIRVSRTIEFGYWHHSQHLLDTEYKYGHFPVEDGIQLKIYLYRSSTYREPLF